MSPGLPRKTQGNSFQRPYIGSAKPSMMARSRKTLQPRRWLISFLQKLTKVLLVDRRPGVSFRLQLIMSVFLPSVIMQPASANRQFPFNCQPSTLQTHPGSRQGRESCSKPFQEQASSFKRPSCKAFQDKTGPVFLHSGAKSNQD